MSVLPHPDAGNAPNIQVWNNTIFDHGEADGSVPKKESSGVNMQPIFSSRSETFDTDSSKENQTSVFSKSPVSVNSPVFTNPLQPNNRAIGNSQEKPLKLLFKQGLLASTQSVSKTANKGIPDDSKINTEIEEIEREIGRLSSKLETLRLEKAEQNLKASEKRGRIVPAKFMEQKQNQKIPATPEKIEESTSTSGSMKFRRRGVSMGPSEIMPGVRLRQPGKLGTTHIESVQNRRKSCFWKLQEIGKEKITDEKGRDLSLNPQPCNSVSRTQSSKERLTTMASKKPVERGDGVVSRIQSKQLFKEGEKSVPPKNPSKNCRPVTSRYSQTTPKSAENLIQIDRCKRSLPENVKDNSKGSENKHSSHVRKTGRFPPESGQIQVKENRGKKKCENPTEAVMAQKSLVTSSPSPVSKMANFLPRIKTVRFTDDSPRDSGPAKRVAELMGRKSYFEAEEREMEMPVSQALCFDHSEEEESLM